MASLNNTLSKINEQPINNKKILCFNMLNTNKCNYGNKCVYAHSLSDQKIEPIRHKAYTIIKGNQDLRNIDLMVDQTLYETLLQLTKMCSLCNKHLCPGGYNCRNGAINMQSKVCYEDFMFGNCKRQNCLATHLTTRGFVPYNKQKNNHRYRENNKINIFKEIEDPPQVNNILEKYNYTNRFKNSKYENNSKMYEDLDNVEGILLTEKFLLARFNKPLNNDDDSSMSEDEEQARLTIEYLNKDDDSTEESIFLV
jgi:hypothetical protein